MDLKSLFKIPLTDAAKVLMRNLALQKLEAHRADFTPAGYARRLAEIDSQFPEVTS